MRWLAGLFVAVWVSLPVVAYAQIETPVPTYTIETAPPGVPTPAAPATPATPAPVGTPTPFVTPIFTAPPGTAPVFTPLVVSTSGFALYLIVVWLAALGFAIFFIATMWRLFTKGGEPGWAAIVPIYNTIVLLKLADKPWWWIFITWLVVPLIIADIDLAKNFGKTTGFGIGLVVLPFIFFPVLAFGDAQYQPLAPAEVSAI